MKHIAARLGLNPGDYSHIAIISAIENIEIKMILELDRLIVLTMLPIAMGSRLQSGIMAITMVVVVMMWWRCGSISWSCVERMVLNVASVWVCGSLFWGLFLLLI